MELKYIQIYEEIPHELEVEAITLHEGKLSYSEINLYEYD